MNLQLIPYPQTWIEKEGTYTGCFDTARIGLSSLNNAQEIGIKKTAHKLFSTTFYSKNNTNFELRLGNTIEASINLPLKFDAYCLSIQQQGIYLFSFTARGFYYGLVTIASLKENYNGKIPCGDLIDWADTEIRAGYWDFRYLFPKKDLLPLYLAEMADCKLNALVIEFENRRPFANYSFLCDEEYALSAEEIQNLQRVAEEHFIDIIPLQQSFGHLEYALKTKELKHLREIPEAYGEICPLKDESKDLVFNLNRDLLNLFPNSTYYHIGCDEVWSLGECDVCKNNGKTPAGLFIAHANQLIDLVCATGKKPLMWHDMLYKATDEELMQLDSRVILCLWEYGSPHSLKDRLQIMSRFEALGITMWAACSVKCWDGNGEQCIPEITKRIENIDAWKQYLKKGNLNGMIITNWAVPFSFGGPYGLFETSLLPNWYAAESCWNINEPSADFLPRFLIQFHGIDKSKLKEYEDINFEEYYSLSGELIQLTNKHKDILILLDILNRYEFYAKKRPLPTSFLFRYDLEGTPEIKESVFQRKTYMENGLMNIYPLMEEILKNFLPDGMIRKYMTAKKYMPEKISQITDNIEKQPV